MSIRKKTVLIISATFLGLVVIFACVAHFQTVHGFEELERRILSDNARRALGVFQEEEAQLASLAGDYAPWDDAWEFMRGLRPDFVEKNATPASMTNLRLNAMLFIDLSNAFVDGKGFDLGRGAETAIPDSLVVVARRYVAALAASGRDKGAGCLMSSEGPAMLAADTIRRSDGSGPEAGWLVAVRWLDDAEIARLSQRARIPLSLHAVDDAEVPESLRGSSGPLSPEDVVIQAASDETIRVWAPLPDPLGGPGLLLETRDDRAISSQGRQAATQYFTLLALSSLALILVALVLLERIALSRLSRLSARVAAIARRGDGSVRLGPQGTDEIGRLAKDIDAMLDSLERAERERRLAEGVYRAVVQDQTDLVCRYLPDGALTFVNDAICRFFGMTRERMLGRDFLDLATKCDNGALSLLLPSLTPESPIGVQEHEVAGPDGDLRWVRCTTRAFFDESGKLTGYQSVGGDITDLKRVEADLRRANEELERRVAERTAELAMANDLLTSQAAELRERQLTAEIAAKAKSDFLATMSHEIRTPMTGVIGMLNLALSSPPSADVSNYLRMALDSADALLAIINDILDFSRIEAGKMTLDRREFDLLRMIESVMEPLALAAREKGLRLSYLVDGPVPARLAGDEGRLRQVLVNVVGNAVKFTEQGEVALTVRLAQDEPRADGGTAVQFSVRDTGVGIAPDKLETIFESFSQLGDASRAQTGGTGLGLAISKRLAEMMGGRIQVESAVDQGSVFTFTVGLERVDADAEPRRGANRPPEAALRGLRILVAEDNLINQILIRELLERRGHQTVVTSNGQEALEALARERFDVALMDARMPVMSGEEAVGVIRRDPPPGVDPSIPVIVLTAHALKGDRERFLAAGMDDYLAKPVEPAELDRALRKALAARRGQARQAVQEDDR